MRQVDKLAVQLTKCWENAFSGQNLTTIFVFSGDDEQFRGVLLGKGGFLNEQSEHNRRLPENMMGNCYFSVDRADVQEHLKQTRYTELFVLLFLFSCTLSGPMSSGLAPEQQRSLLLPSGSARAWWQPQQGWPGGLAEDAGSWIFYHLFWGADVGLREEWMVASESIGQEMCLLWVVLGGLVVAHEGLNTRGWPCGGASSWGVATLGLMAMPGLLWSKETSSLAVLWLKATSGLAAALLLAVKLQGWPSLLLDWLQEGHYQVKLVRRVCYPSPDRTWRKKPGGKESSPFTITHLLWWTQHLLKNEVQQKAPSQLGGFISLFVWFDTGSSGYLWACLSQFDQFPLGFPLFSPFLSSFWDQTNGRWHLLLRTKE